MNAMARTALLLGFAALPLCVFAQNADSAAAAPIPAPILSAKKVFVGNAGTDMNAQANGSVFSQDLGTRAYESFYRGLQAWGHYQLVDTPADADLVFEIGVRSQGDGSHNLSGNSLRFDLTIFDSKTHFALWRFVEGFDYSSLHESSRDRNFNRHMDHMLSLVKNLSQGNKS
jgi:hypothetical protein